jgi:hypothetical protein
MNRVKQAEERRLELAKKGAPHGTDILGLNDRCKCGHRRSVHIVSDPEGQPTQCAYCICIEFRIASRAWKPI